MHGNRCEAFVGTHASSKRRRPLGGAEFPLAGAPIAKRREQLGIQFMTLDWRTIGNVEQLVAIVVKN